VNVTVFVFGFPGVELLLPQPPVVEKRAKKSATTERLFIPPPTLGVPQGREDCRNVEPGFPANFTTLL
jgi:hypothetical protein